MYIRVPVTCNRSDPCSACSACSVTLWYIYHLITMWREGLLNQIRSNTFSNDPNCQWKVDVLDLPESNGYFQVSHLVKPPVNCPLRIAAETQTSRTGQGPDTNIILFVFSDVDVQVLILNQCHSHSSISTRMLPKALVQSPPYQGR